MLNQNQQLTCTLLSRLKAGLFHVKVFFDGRRYSVQDQSFALFVRVAQKRHWPVIFRRRNVFPVFQYGDDLRLPPYCWDLVLSEAVVEHCKQPLVSFGPNIL